MKRQIGQWMVLGCVVTLGLIVAAAEAATPNRATTIIITMENENCANRIAASLREVPNVGEARADVPRRIVTVTPAGLRSPSPRALWEAVEKTSHTVVQLQGPHGKFTSKPEN